MSEIDPIKVVDISTGEAPLNDCTRDLISAIAELVDEHHPQCSATALTTVLGNLLGNTGDDIDDAIAEASRALAETAHAVARMVEGEVRHTC